jgi:hypothetical protein
VRGHGYTWPEVFLGLQFRKILLRLDLCQRISFVVKLPDHITCTIINEIRLIFSMEIDANVIACACGFLPILNINP